MFNTFYIQLEWEYLPLIENLVVFKYSLYCVQQIYTCRVVMLINRCVYLT